MKKPTHLLAALAVLLLTGSGSAALAQTTPKAPAKAAKGHPMPDHCQMKDGKMTMMKGGKRMPMTADMTMSDGSMCLTNGTCKMKDGAIRKMKEGECMMMDGKMTMHPGSTKRPMMHGDKMDHMKM